MSKREHEGEISDTKNRRLKKELSVDEAILVDPVEEKDSTDSLGDTIKETFQPILDKFKELIRENKDKKSFIGALIKIFTILLITNIKNVLRVNTKIGLDLWPEQKLP